jgi:hypothetical protein
MRLEEEAQMGEGYDHAVALLRSCISEAGFLASPTHSANYRRVWGRDGIIMGLGALAAGGEEFASAFRRTLQTLARHQGPHGEIPSNVDPRSGRISYGGTTGRVDADLWFVVGCGEYWRSTQDESFLHEMLPVLERVRFLLGAWEFNSRGLLYIPLTGDWADEYLQHGYVLYDQLIYYQALLSLAAIRRDLREGEDAELAEKASRLRSLIRVNYWLVPGEEVPQGAYHPVLYRRGRRAAERSGKQYWMPFFSPTGYGYRVDAFANVLASLFDIADDEQREIVDKRLLKIAPAELPLLPAFHPVIRSVDEDWADLQMTFTYEFRNNPYEYHNGGLWPLITGFWVADLASRGRHEVARRSLSALHRANAMEMDGEAWSFPEYLHGKELTPGGTRHLGWSAAAAVIGQKALEGVPIFRVAP